MVPLGPAVAALTRRLLWLAWAACAASALGAQPNGGGSDSAPATQRRHRLSSAWLPRLKLDNDAYNFWIHPGRRSDEEYTNGVLASFEALHGTVWPALLGAESPGCDVAPASGGRCLTTTVSVGQDMYTPNLRRPPFSEPNWQDERPYAAWLYLGLTGRSVSRRSQRAIDLQLGVTGRPALGEVSQKVAHWINRRYTTPARGWETQVGFQPGVQLGYTHSLVALRGLIKGKGIADLVPTATATLGTVRTAGEIGAKARLGYNISHPFDPRAWRGRTPLEYWVSAGGRATYVARDFSLDGSLLNDTRHVDRVARVRDYSFGAGLRMHKLALQWEATTRSRQYKTGPGHFTYSSMSASWEFYR